MARNITIRPMLNGFVVDVGCQTVVFPNVKQLADAVRDYYSDPARTEKWYLANAVNKPSDELRSQDCSEAPATPYPTPPAERIR